jgi:hypothetical protein
MQYNGTTVDCVQTISGPGPAPHSASIGWIATANPNNSPVVILPAASTITSIVGNVETAIGNSGTVSVNKAPAGTACSAGTTLHSGSVDANNVNSHNNQTLTVTTTALGAGDRACLVTTGGANWTSGAGVGGVTITYTTP